MPTNSPNSAFFARLQQDDIDLVELIDVELPGGGKQHFTTCNQPVTFTLSGAATTYTPFAGGTSGGVQKDTALGVAVIDFTMQNTITAISNMAVNNDFALAGLKIGRVFASTPDLGRMDIYVGQIGDFSFDRIQLKGQGRNIWKSLSVQWPYYLHQDTCVWRFGSQGCGINANSFGVLINSVNVSSSTTLDIYLPTGTLSAYSNGRFDFGRLIVTGGVNSGAQRTIRNHSGDHLSLAYDLSESDLTGITLQINPGCRKRVTADCKSIYNNTQNFLGFWAIPTQENAF